MTRFMSQNLHQTRGIAALDAARHAPLQPLETRMCEIKGYGDARYAVGREPLVRKPEMWLEQNAARREFATQSPNGPLQRGPPRQPEAQIAKSKSQQLSVGVARPLRWFAASHEGTARSEAVAQPHEHLGEEFVGQRLDLLPSVQGREPSRRNGLDTEHGAGQLTRCRAVNVGITTGIDGRQHGILPVLSAD